MNSIRQSMLMGLTIAMLSVSAVVFGGGQQSERIEDQDQSSELEKESRLIKNLTKDLDDYYRYFYEDGAKNPNLLEIEDRIRDDRYEYALVYGEDAAKRCVTHNSYKACYSRMGSVLPEDFIPRLIDKHSYLCNVVGGFECEKFHEKIKSYGLEALVIRRHNVCNGTGSGRGIDDATKSKLIKELDETMKIVLER